MITLWCTGRSIAAAVGIGSLKICSTVERAGLLVSSTPVARNDEPAGKQHLHLLATVLHVANVVDDQSFELVNRFSSLQPEL